MAVELNPDAFEFASKMIREGKVLRDQHGDWHSQQPTTEDENAYLENHSYSDYGNWHLGINTDDNPETKRYYEFPYSNGAFTQVVRAGLIAVEDRAGQYGHTDIEDAAKKLIAQIDER